MGNKILSSRKNAFSLSMGITTSILYFAWTLHYWGMDGQLYELLGQWFVLFILALFRVAQYEWLLKLVSLHSPDSQKISFISFIEIKSSPFLFVSGSGLGIVDVLSLSTIYLGVSPLMSSNASFVSGVNAIVLISSYIISMIFVAFFIARPLGNFFLRRA